MSADASHYVLQFVKPDGFGIRQGPIFPAAELIAVKLWSEKLAECCACSLRIRRVDGTMAWSWSPGESWVASGPAT